MPIADKEEYHALRQEMMELFERIYDTTKYGVLAFTAFLSFYYSQPSFDDTVALLVFQSVTLWVALNTVNNFEKIYTQGTYIRLVLEKGSRAQWHKTSREYDKYYRKFMDKKGKKPWWIGRSYLGKRWGRDPAVYAYTILFLTGSGILTVLSKTNFQIFLPPTFQDLIRTALQNLFPTILLWVSISLFAINLYIAYKLTFGMRKFREETEEVWQAYLDNLRRKSKNTHNQDLTKTATTIRKKGGLRGMSP